MNYLGSLRRRPSCDFYSVETGDLPYLSVANSPVSEILTKNYDFATLCICLLENQLVLPNAVTIVKLVSSFDHELH